MQQGGERRDGALLRRAIGVDVRSVATRTPRPPNAMRSSDVRWAYMYTWAMSPTTSRSDQPTSSQNLAGRGSVAIMDEFIGSHVRCSPARSAVNPSVTRSTKGARTTPWAETRRPGADEAPGCPRKCSDPEPRTASAIPATSFAGWMRAACGCHAAPTPAIEMRSRARTASDTSRSVSGHACLVRRPVLQPRELCWGAGDGELATLDDVGIDALARGHRDHLVDGLAERPLLRDRGIPPMGLLYRSRPPVTDWSASRRCDPSAEPGESLLQHDDPQVGLRAFQVVRGPQAGVPGADDRDVGVDSNR